MCGFELTSHVLHRVCRHTVAVFYPSQTRTVPQARVYAGFLIQLPIPSHERCHRVTSTFICPLSNSCSAARKRRSTRRCTGRDAPPTDITTNMRRYLSSFTLLPTPLVYNSLQCSYYLHVLLARASHSSNSVTLPPIEYFATLSPTSTALSPTHEVDRVSRVRVTSALQASKASTFKQPAPRSEVGLG